MKKQLWLDLSEQEAESVQGGSTQYSGIPYPIIVKFTSNLHNASLQGGVHKSGQVPIFGGHTEG